MRALHIYGASDDLVEVEGNLPGCDEYSGDDVKFVIGGCLLVRVTYGGHGVWAIQCAPVDEDVPVPFGVDLYAEGYSMHLRADVPSGTSIVKVA
jgi:hypothetical protein